MSDETSNSTPGSWLGLVGLLCLLAGWIVAIVLAGGLELHRSAVAMPLIVVGSLLGLGDALRTGRSVRAPVLWTGLLAMGYFLVRAAMSEVWDLGRHDLHLISLAWLTIATVATCAVTRRQVVALLIVLILVFGGHFLAGIYQRFIDAEFTFFRRARHSSAGVSGLFWQWNNLAGLLALLLPLFLGLSLTHARWRVRGLFGVLVLAGVLLAYLTKSRMGFGAVAGGLFCVGALVILNRSRHLKAPARLASVLGIGMLAVLALGLVLLVASKLSAQRGQGSDLESALGASSRPGLAGIAFDVWQENPVFGNGSQSFNYLSAEFWDSDLPSWIGDPELVHNEYMQVLCDYGLIGLILILLFLLVVFWSALSPGPEPPDGPDQMKRGLRIGAVGGLVAGMMHAAFDFQPHLLPILMMAAMLVGILAQPVARSQGLVRGVNALMIVLSAIVAITAVGKESLNTVGWMNWERERVAKGGVVPGELPGLRKLVEASPHYTAARMYGRLQLRAYLLTPDEDKSEVVFGLEEARWGLELARKRHPKDPRTLINLGLVLDHLEEFEAAAVIHLQAVKACSPRERTFGAYGGISLHLAMRGSKLFSSRRSAEALGCFLLAQEYLELSLRRGYKFGGRADYHERRENLKFLIKLLQDGKIQPEFPPDILNRFPRKIGNPTP